MQALILYKTKDLRIEDFPIEEEILGPKDVRIAIHTVGICGSDVHYYEHGRIGDFIVKEPLILGHEASGTVVEIGSKVTTLKPGDRVCMEPGIPDPDSRASRMGMYNIDPAVRFWATPPIHGCLRTTVVHPEDYTFKLPNNVSYAEGAMVEPLAIGLHAANKARIKNGDIAVVIGAGTIGIVSALSAIANGVSTVIITDIVQKRLDFCSQYPNLYPVNSTKEDPRSVVDSLTNSWGADVVFEASGAPESLERALALLAPGGCIVQIGCPINPIAFSVSHAQVKEARFEFIFRYAHVYPRALNLLGSGKIDVKPMITKQYEFKDSVRAFNEVLSNKEGIIKAQILLPEE